MLGKVGFSEARISKMLDWTLNLLISLCSTNPVVSQTIVGTFLSFLKKGGFQTTTKIKPYLNRIRNNFHVKWVFFVVAEMPVIVHLYEFKNTL